MNHDLSEFTTITSNDNTAFCDPPNTRELIILKTASINRLQEFLRGEVDPVSRKVIEGDLQLLELKRDMLQEQLVAEGIGLA